ncbi:MAG: DNA polymerase III subunit [Ignavibacteriales bacterium]|nr:DNA polymerase III subunit [Ignavibacteriales bacterium]
MSWNSVIGQRRVKELLRRTIENGQIPHAYLFHGIEGAGQDAAAFEFARVLNCERQALEACETCSSCKKSELLSHPNINLIFRLPVGKGETKDDSPFEKLSDEQMSDVREQLSQKAGNPYHEISVPKANFIKINSIREIRRAASMSSFERGKKVFIVCDAEHMNAESGNSLLKTLEEPPANTILILTTSQKSKLLTTILSRCQPVQFDPVEESDLRDALVAKDGVEVAQAAIVARLANGSYKVARELLARDWIQERQEAVDFLRIILSAQRINLSMAIERLSSLHDRNSLERWLKVLQSWVRDALVVRESGSAGFVDTATDAAVDNFVKKFPRANLLSALDAVDRHIALLSKNVYIPLVLTNLAIDLKNHLAETST